MGSANTRFGRNVPLKYAYPGSDEDILTPNPRTISLELLARDTFKPVPFLNLFAAAFALNRKFFLKDTGRKLSHLDKQLHVGQTEVRATSLEEEVD